LIASSARTRTRRPSIDEISIRWSPMGLGRCGDRVLKTPSSCRAVSPPGVNTQYVPPSAIQPGEEKHLLAGPKTSKCDEDFGHEDQHSLRSALVRLARRCFELGQR
jgi:hypothetical protein